MLFSWKKNRVKKRIFINKNNDDLVNELREKGITDKNILNAIQKILKNLLQYVRQIK